MKRREIKFRAFEPYHKKMIYNILIGYTGWMTHIHNSNNVWDCKLMQYTGIKDVNGVEIYEGDTVNCIDNQLSIQFKGVVEFNDASFLIKDVEIGHYRWIDYEIEVTGNIYEVTQ